MRFGLFEVDLREQKLTKGERPVRLESKPFRILAALLENPGKVMSRDDLRAQLWPDGTYVDFDEGLNTAISKLRYALGDSAEAPVFVETIPRRGYRFLAPVSVCEAVRPPIDAAATATPVHADLVTIPLDSTRAASEATIPADALARRRRNRLLIFAAFCLVGGAILWAVYRTFEHFSPAAVRQTLEVRKLTDSGEAVLAAISPDGRYVAYARRVGEKFSLRLRQVESVGDVEILPPEEVNFAGLTFSPDGNNLYFVRSNKDDPGYRYLYMMPALGDPTKKLITDIDAPVSFSPDGRQFVFTRGLPTRNSTDVRLANGDGSDERLLVNVPETFVGYQPGPAWSPDGTTIAVAVRHHGKDIRSCLYTISARSGKVREFYSTAAFIGRPLWAPSGEEIVLTMEEKSTYRAQLWSISYPEGRARRITNDLSDYGLRIEGSRDGSLLVATGHTVASSIWSWRRDNAQLQAVTTYGTPHLKPSNLQMESSWYPGSIAFG